MSATPTSGRDSYRQILASRSTEAVEVVSECLAVLQQMVPQLSTEERTLVAMQHPFATSAWLDGLVALSQGRLSEDLILIADLERELANCQVLVTSRTEELRVRRTPGAEATPTGSASGDTSAASRQPAAPAGRRVAGDSGRGTPGPSGHGTPAGPSPAFSKRTPPASVRHDELMQTAEELEAELHQLAGLAEADGDEDVESDQQQRISAYEALGEGEGEGEGDSDIDEDRRSRRQDGERFDSISEEIKALNEGLISEPSTVKEVDDRVTCKWCGRKFAPGRLQKHTEICKESKKNKEYRTNLAKPNIRL